ncbi:MAG: hypothetical protein V4669_11560 [Pseudomonadota bacterium]
MDTGPISAPDEYSAAILAEREAWARLQNATLGDPTVEQKRRALLAAAEGVRQQAQTKALARPALNEEAAHTPGRGG